MSIQQSLLVAISTAAASFAMLLLVLTWARRSVAGARPFAGLVLAGMLWLVLAAIEALVPALNQKIFLAKLEYVGISSLAVFWLLFALDYSQQAHRLSRPWRLALWIIPAITLLLAWTNEAHHLIWTRITPIPTPLGTGAIYQHGAWFFIALVFNYLLMLAGSLLLVWANLSRAYLRRAYLRRTQRYRRQTITMLLAAGAPLAANLLYVSGLNPIPGIDLTPYGFLISAACITWSFTRYQMLDIIPVAHQALIENLLDAILVLDVHGRLADLNPRAQQLLALNREKDIGRPLQILQALWPDLTSRIQSTGETFFETELQLPAGNSYFEIHAALLSNRTGQTLGYALSLRDISARLRAEERLRLQSTALNAAANGIVITNLQGSIIWVNPAFTRMTGYSLEEAVGQNPRLLKSGQHDSNFYAQLWDTILAGQMWHGEVINQRKDGSLYDEEMSIAPVHNDDGELQYFIAIKQDVTQRKAIEQALNQSNLERQRLQEAEAIDHERSRIAQEIHNGLTQNLDHLRQQLSQWQRLGDDPQQILAEIQTLQSIAENSLKAARRSIFALRPLTLETRGFMPTLESFAHGFNEYYGLKVRVELLGLEENIPVRLELTMFRVIQEMLNVIAQHAQARKVQVTIDLRLPNAVRLRIVDDGVGMSAKRLKEVEVSGEYGLSAMRQRMEAMGGSLQLISSPGHGVEMEIILPLE